MTSNPQALPARFPGARPSFRRPILAAVAALGTCLTANGAIVFTGSQTFTNPGGTTVASGGATLPTNFPLGSGHMTSLSFNAPLGPTTGESISWTIERLDGNVGPAPMSGDFWVGQMGLGGGMDPGPVTVAFDGLKTYTFTIQTPSPTYAPPSGGPAIYNYLIGPRAPGGDIPVGGNENSIIFTTQQFRLIAIPEPASALLSGLGLLALLRRRR